MSDSSESSEKTPPRKTRGKKGKLTLVSSDELRQGSYGVKSALNPEETEDVRMNRGWQQRTRRTPNLDELDENPEILGR